MKKLILIFVFGSIVMNVSAIKVYLSEFTKNTLCVQLTADEVSKMKKGTIESNGYGEIVAEKICEVTGMPQSITGKIINIDFYPILCMQYQRSLTKACMSTPENQNLTLRYTGDIEVIEKLWKTLAPGDALIPGSFGAKTALQALNGIVNLLHD